MVITLTTKTATTNRQSKSDKNDLKWKVRVCNIMCYHIVSIQNIQRLRFLLLNLCFDTVSTEACWNQNESLFFLNFISIHFNLFNLHINM